MKVISHSLDYQYFGRCVKSVGEGFIYQGMLHIPTLCYRVGTQDVCTTGEEVFHLLTGSYTHKKWCQQLTGSYPMVNRMLFTLPTGSDTQTAFVNVLNSSTGYFPRGNPDHYIYSFVLSSL